MHPEKYFERREAHRSRTARPHLPKGYKSLVGGSLGELEHRILLEQYVGKETRCRDRASLARLQFRLAWRIRRTAAWCCSTRPNGTARMRRARYFTAYRQMLAKKWKKMTVTSETTDRVVGTGDDGGFELRRKGAIVTSVEGLPPAIK